MFYKCFSAQLFKIISIFSQGCWVFGVDYELIFCLCTVMYTVQYIHENLFCSFKRHEQIARGNKQRAQNERKKIIEMKKQNEKIYIKFTDLTHHKYRISSYLFLHFYVLFHSLILSFYSLLLLIFFFTFCCFFLLVFVSNYRIFFVFALFCSLVFCGIYFFLLFRRLSFGYISFVLFFVHLAYT